MSFFIATFLREKANLFGRSTYQKKSHVALYQKRLSPKEKRWVIRAKNFAEFISFKMVGKSTICLIVGYYKKNSKRDRNRKKKHGVTFKLQKLRRFFPVVNEANCIDRPACWFCKLHESVDAEHELMNIWKIHTFILHESKEMLSTHRKQDRDYS